MILQASLFPDFSPSKDFIRRCLLLLCLLSITIVASAQQGRYLQTLNLFDIDNRPFYATTHSLPAYILAGINAGAITPYRVDYATKKAEPFTVAAKESLLHQINVSPDSADYLSPRMLNELDVDVIRNKKGISKINYLNFHMVYFADEVPRMREDKFKDYFFSVSFDQVAAYLTKQNALWVKNAGPLLWKNHVVHTYGQHAFSVLSNVIPELEDNAMEQHVALTLDKNGGIAKVGTYSMQYELVQDVVLPDSLYSAGEILSMPEALLAGRYQPNKEMVLKTKLPAIKFKYRTEPLDASYVLMQTEKLYLDHPANQAYFKPEQELSALLVEAVSIGAVSTYASDSLLTIMPRNQWNDNLKVKEYDLFGDGYKLSEANYLPLALSVITITWKLQVDAAGKVISKAPYALGLYLGAKNTPLGLESLIGYLSFEELYQSAKASKEHKQLLHLLDNLANSKYMGYLSHTSEMMLYQK